MQIGWWQRPHHHERVCGDAVAWLESAEFVLLAVIDGLGHGPEAERAAQLARAAILGAADEPPPALLQRCHQALRPTRGAAIAILRIGRRSRTCRFAGIGNVALSSTRHRSVHPISHPGIVGHRMRKIQEFCFELERDEVLCLSSDGVSSKLELGSLDRADLTGSARRLVERYGVPHDDVTVALLAGS